MIPVNRTIGELRPSTPSSRDTPSLGAHTYSSINLKPLPEPAFTNIIIDSPSVNNVVKRAMILGAEGLFLKPRIQREPIRGNTRR